MDIFNDKLRATELIINDYLSLMDIRSANSLTVGCNTDGE